MHWGRSHTTSTLLIRLISRILLQACNVARLTLKLGKLCVITFHVQAVVRLFEDLVEGSLWDPTFIVDYPVPLPEEVVGAASFELGRVVFLMVEFQLLDEETARRNEEGENAHHLYKQRQGRVVAERLKRGALNPTSRRRKKS